LSRFLISNCDDCFLGLNRFFGWLGSCSMLNTEYLLRFFFGSFFSLLLLLKFKNLFCLHLLFHFQHL
jgi:hypothetical protein